MYKEIDVAKFITIPSLLCVTHSSTCHQIRVVNNPEGIQRSMHARSCDGKFWWPRTWIHISHVRNWPCEKRKLELEHWQVDWLRNWIAIELPPSCGEIESCKVHGRIAFPLWCLLKVWHCLALQCITSYSHYFRILMARRSVAGAQFSSPAKPGFAGQINLWIGSHCTLYRTRICHLYAISMRFASSSPFCSISTPKQTTTFHHWQDSVSSMLFSIVPVSDIASE